MDRDKGEWYCYMMVVDHSASSSETENKTPNRTILGVSQDPYHDLMVQNEYGPVRTSQRTNLRRPKSSQHPKLAKPRMRRASGKSRKRRYRYRLAVVVSGFGCDYIYAKNFLEKWNDGSRGPIPRASLAGLLAQKYKLEIFWKKEHVLGQDFLYYDIIMDAQCIRIIRKTHNGNNNGNNNNNNVICTNDTDLMDQENRDVRNDKLGACCNDDTSMLAN